MSPDRGQDSYPAAMHDDYFSRTTGTKVMADRIGSRKISSFLREPIATEPGIYGPYASQSQTTEHRTSHPSEIGDRDEVDISEACCPLNQAAASVKSMSSTGNSRRDSAVSAESKRSRRPKTSRSNTKNSLQSAPGESLSRTSSRSALQRPRGHRFVSSTSINAPRTNIEEALALHARSCQIFSSFSQPSTSCNPSTSPYSSYGRPNHHRSLSSDAALPMSQHADQQISPYSAGASVSAWDMADDDDQHFSSSFPPTVLHWTSDEVRKDEYAAIDRANTGVRGLFRRLLPKCISTGRGKFYNEKDGSDAGSVRRIRLDFPVNNPEVLRSNLPRQLSN